MIWEKENTIRAVFENVPSPLLSIPPGYRVCLSGALIFREQDLGPSHVRQILLIDCIPGGEKFSSANMQSNETPIPNLSYFGIHSITVLSACELESISHAISSTTV